MYNKAYIYKSKVYGDLKLFPFSPPLFFSSPLVFILDLHLTFDVHSSDCLGLLTEIALCPRMRMALFHGVFYAIRPDTITA